MFKQLKRLINFIKRKRYEATEFTAETRDIVDDIGELNEKYIKKFIDLYTHYSVVDAEYYVVARSALTAQYKAELSLKRAEARATTIEKFYLADGKTDELGIWSIRRWGKRYDSPMKEALDKRIKREARGHLAEIEAGIEPKPEYESAQAELFDLIINTLETIQGSRGLFNRRNRQNTEEEIALLAAFICDLIKRQQQEIAEQVLRAEAAQEPEQEEQAQPEEPPTEAITEEPDEEAQIEELYALEAEQETEESEEIEEAEAEEPESAEPPIVEADIEAKESSEQVEVEPQGNDEEQKE